MDAGSLDMPVRASTEITRQPIRRPHEPPDGSSPAARRAAHQRRLGLRQPAGNRLGADAVRGHLDQGALRRQGEGRDDLPAEMGTGGNPADAQAPGDRADLCRRGLVLRSRRNLPRRRIRLAAGRIVPRNPFRRGCGHSRDLPQAERVPTQHRIRPREPRRSQPWRYLGHSPAPPRQIFLNDSRDLAAMCVVAALRLSTDS